MKENENKCQKKSGVEQEQHGKCTRVHFQPQQLKGPFLLGLYSIDGDVELSGDFLVFQALKKRKRDDFFTAIGKPHQGKVNFSVDLSPDQVVQRNGIL